MISKNITIQQAENAMNHADKDCASCRMHMVSEVGLVECLMEVIRSQWVAPFGTSRFCEHSSAKQFIDLVNSSRPVSNSCPHEDSVAHLDMDITGKNLNENYASPSPIMSAEQVEIIGEVLAALEADQLDLPVLPDMAIKVGKLLDDPDSSAGQFVQLLSTDLSISMYLIKAANCAALSNGRPVGNLHDAIPRLGYRMLYSMVMNITMTKLFRANSPHINQKLKELWEHSRIVAANCYVLAQQHRHLKPEDAMLAGLVHDIGALPLYLYADRHHPEIAPAILDELLSQFSAPVGIKLLQSWNFPDELVDVVADHENLQRISNFEIADYVDVVTMANLQTQETAKAVAWRNVFAAERLGCYSEDCKNFVPNHAEQFAAVNSILEIDMARAA